MINVTIGQLRKLINSLPEDKDDAVLSYQRIEDAYFTERTYENITDFDGNPAVFHPWKVDLVPDDTLPEDAEIFDEFVNASTMWFDSENNKLRISAHF